MSGIKNIFGGGAIHKEKYGFATIDTAALYGQSEKVLGQSDAYQRFAIDTKIPGGVMPRGASRENVLAVFEKSRTLLGHPVDILYIHAPDTSTPLEETAGAINEIYQTGFFKRFGLSNYRPADVEKLYDICKANSYVLPSVYQGNYSAVARKQEKDLLPLLRRLNMSFYAYSPIAGGFLAKTRAQLEQGSGRWERGTFLGDLYHDMYSKPAILEALDEWNSIARDEGTTSADLAYRWVKYNSALKPDYGDGIVVGASSFEQLETTVKALNNGPLSDSAAKRIDAIWEKIEPVAPMDNFHGDDGEARSFEAAFKEREQ